MKLPTDKTVFQSAWVVPDVEAAAMQWVDTMGVGPFYIGDYGPGVIDNIRHRGKPAELAMRVAIAQAGPQQIELIQQVSDGPSCYRDTVPEGESRFHHICVWTDDLDADMKFYADKGCEIATYGEVVGGPRFCYVDTQAEMHCMLEILERHPMIDGAFKMIADAAVDWDGQDPIRSYG